MSRNLDLPIRAKLAALRAVGGEFHISIGFFGTISLRLLESVGGAFKIIRQTHLQHIEAPSLMTVGGDLVFQGLQALHTVCNIGMEWDWMDWMDWMASDGVDM